MSVIIFTMYYIHIHIPIKIKIVPSQLDLIFHPPNALKLRTYNLNQFNHFSQFFVYKMVWFEENVCNFMYWSPC